MKKILDLLEQKVQWIVLGIAVLYAGYMGYTYLLTPQATAEIGAEPVALGDIDHKTLEDQVSRLEAQINKPGLVQPATMPSYVTKFKDMMAHANEPAAKWEDAPVIVQQLPPFKLEELDAPGAGGLANAPQGAKNVDLVKLIAPAKMGPTRTGVTSVQVAPPAGNVAVAAAGVDKVWATVRYEINPKDLADAFDAAKVPEKLDTVFVSIKLERQELNNGAWGPPTVVAPLPTVQLKPVPPANAAKQVHGPFLDWAKAHQLDILHPPFYKRIRGDEWAVPEDKEAAAAPAPAPAPTAPRGRGPTPAPRGNAPRGGTAPRGNAPRGSATPPARGGTNQRGRGTTPAPTPAPADGGAAEFHFAPQVAADPPISFQQEVPAAADQAQPEAGAEPAAPVSTVYPAPDGNFDPRKWQSTNANIPNIVGWAHDDKVEPGHTYRYRVTYTIKNPVAFRDDIVKNPNIAAQVYIESPPSEWSREIEISSTINFFLAKKGSTPGAVTIQVFKNQGGQMHTKLFDVTAGDMIGEPSAGVDFVTGWTLVDLRDDQKGEPYVLLMDQAGAIHRRTLKEDQSSDKYTKFKAMVAGGGGAAPAGAPVAAGGAAGRGGP